MRIGRTRDVITAEPLVSPVPGTVAGPAEPTRRQAGPVEDDSGALARCSVRLGAEPAPLP